jgi:hypothetical protein
VTSIEIVHSHPNWQEAPSMWNDPISSRWRNRFSWQDKIASLQLKALFEMLEKKGFSMGPIDLKFGIIFSDADKKLEKTFYILSKELSLENGDYRVNSRLQKALDEAGFEIP